MNTEYNMFLPDTLSKALELTKGQPPEYSIAPLIELINSARSLGFDVCRRTVSDMQAAQSTTELRKAT